MCDLVCVLFTSLTCGFFFFFTRENIYLSIRRIVRAKLAHVSYLIVLKCSFWGGQETSSVEMTEEYSGRTVPIRETLITKVKVITINFVSGFQHLWKGMNLERDSFHMVGKVCGIFLNNRFSPNLLPPSTHAHTHIEEITGRIYIQNFSKLVRDSLSDTNCFHHLKGCHLFLFLFKKFFYIGI